MTPEERAAVLGERFQWTLDRRTLEEAAAPIIREAEQSATLLERERCAGILDAAADRQKAAWDKLRAEKHPGPYTSFELIFRGFAEDIRKGSP